MRWLLPLLLLTLLGGCETSDGHTLLVDVRTDLVPGVEFAVVDVAVFPVGSTSEMTTSRRVMAGDRYVDGQRVAQYESVPAGATNVRARMTGSGGALVLERTLRVEISGPTGITLVLTRDCEGVSCPMGGDDPIATECLNARCVPPSCSSASPADCGEPRCGADGDCEGDGLCAEGRCREGVCLLVGAADACSGEEVCVPGDGCVGAPDPDGGLPDGGPMDAGADAGADAETDAAVPLDPQTFLNRADAFYCERVLACSPKLSFLIETICNPEQRGRANGFFSAAADAFSWLDAGSGSRFDPEIGERCLAALVAPTSSCVVDQPPECVGVFSGTIAEDGACAGHAECAGGRCFRLGAECRPGICRRFRDIGESCADSPLDECDGQVSKCEGGTCVALVDEGGACGSGSPCRFGNICADGVCRRGPLVGESCSVWWQDPCEGVSICASGTCTVGVGLGEACSPTIPCAPGGRCVAEDGLCRRVVAPGGRCSDDNDCPLSFECRAAVCAPLGFLGSECDASRPCQVGGCVGGACQRLAAGEVCDGVWQCAGSCVGSTCSPPSADGNTCGGASAMGCEEGLVCRATGCVTCPAPS